MLSAGFATGTGESVHVHMVDQDDNLCNWHHMMEVKIGLYIY